MYGTIRGVTTDKFLTSCELAHFLLTRTMTLFGTLRKNKPEIVLIGNKRRITGRLYPLSLGEEMVKTTYKKTG